MPGLNPNKTVIRFERRKEVTTVIDRRVPITSSNDNSQSNSGESNSGESNSSGGSGD